MVQVVRGLSPKASVGEEVPGGTLLYVSFECDSLSEELGEKRKFRRLSENFCLPT